MQSIDMTAKVEKFIRYGLIAVLVPAMLIGYAEFKYWHRSETIHLDDAKVVGTMVSVRVLANGKVKELTFSDGDEVKAGDVIARLEVSITEEEIKQLENTVQLAKNNYATLQEGQWVKVPVQRERVIQVPAASSGSSGNLAKLEERANRMAELFEMGAVSAVQRDAARRAYEQARSQGDSGGGGGGGTRVEYYTEYVDEFRPTPPEVLAGAEQAIRQAELSLNVALQEARETEVVAPVSGTIYYGAAVDDAIVAGDSVARIGDSRDLWIEAEVTEDIFDKITLGKLAGYTIDGKEIFGTVTEKLKPDEKPAADETVELPDIPTTTNKPGALIGDGQTPAPADGQTPAPTNGQTPAPADGQTPAPTNGQTPAPTNGQTPAPANGQTPAPADGQTPAPADGQTPAPTDGQTPALANGQTPPPANQGQPPKLPDGTESQPKPNDKFIVKISLPAERDFECRPNTAVKVVIKDA